MTPEVLSYKQGNVRSPAWRLTDHGMRQAWTRHCPCCGRWLMKHDPMAPWVCSCGWQSG